MRGQRSHGRGGKLALFCLTLALSWLLFPWLQRGRQVDVSLPVQRWLGPVATLACDFQWIRYQRALLAGEYETALERAESALALDPGSTEGWQLIASHFALFRASPEREPSLELRRGWFRAGVNATERGASSARDPGELHFLRGLLYLSKIEIDPQLLPGGVPELRGAAIESFEQAAGAGHAQAESILRDLRVE